MKSIFGFAKARSCKNGAGPQLVATVDHVHVGGVARDEETLVQGRVAATDDRDVHVLEEGGVTGGAVGDAVAGEPVLAGDVEAVVVGAGGDDDRLRRGSRRRPS